MYRRNVHLTAVFATVFAGVVVILGAWTRLVDAGLGCPDWPGCYGFLTVPETAEEIAIAEARFPAAPVEVEKGWPEMIHRYFASTLGLILLSLAAYVTVVRRRAQNSETESALPVRHVYGLLVLVICQGLFGMWTVTLKLWPQVVSAHLMGGFTTLALLFLLVLRTKPDRPSYHEPSAPRVLDRAGTFAMLGLVLVAVQIFLGAWTASNYAALACGDELLGCQGSVWPEMNFVKGFDLTQAVGPNYLGGTMDNESRVAIQMSHRMGAIIVTLYLLWLATKLWKFSRAMESVTVRMATVSMLAILCIQFLLGVSNVVFLVPLIVAAAHNAVGALLLLSLVNVNYQLYRIQQQ